MVNCAVAEFWRCSGAGPFLSRTFTVNVKFPAKVALPEIVPFDLLSLSPFGRLPATTCHE